MKNTNITKWNVKNFIYKNKLLSKIHIYNCLGYIGVLFYFFTNLLNTHIALDDMHFSVMMPNVAQKHGWFYSLWMFFIGADLPGEYRTYGLSRVIHFLLWSLPIPQDISQSLFMSGMMFITILSIRYILHSTGRSQFIIFLVSIIIPIAPSLQTNCFHYYSYLIFPIQLIIIYTGLLFWVRQNKKVNTSEVAYCNKKILFISFMMGCFIALSGESHIPFLAFLLVILWFKIDKRYTVACAVGGIFSIMIHYWTWSIFYKNIQSCQRFTLGVPSINTTLSRLFKFYYGLLWGGPCDQLRLIFSNQTNFNYFLVISVVLIIFSLFFYFNLRNAKDQSLGENRYSLISNDLLLFVVVLISIFLLALMPLFTALVAGNVYEVFPRRYGFVIYTIATVYIIISLRHKLFALIVLSLVFSISLVQSMAVYSVRKQDKNIYTKIKSDYQCRPSSSTVIIVSDNKIPAMNYGTVGPRGIDGCHEAFESNLLYLWSTSCKLNIMGINAVHSIKLPIASQGKINHEKNSSNFLSKNILGVIGLDISTSKPVFWSFPESFKHIKVLDVKKTSPARINIEDTTNSTIINMGDTQNNISYALPDQRFSISKKGSLVKSYGLFSGENRIHILEYNSHPLFKSNRHGDFVYKVTLREPSTIIVKVDVVDHWLVEPNKRIFELNVSVDGEAFIPVAKIDPSVDSNAIPRSLTISFKLDQCSEFAIQTKSLIELPLIQCLRIKPL